MTQRRGLLDLPERFPVLPCPLLSCCILLSPGRQLPASLALSPFEKGHAEPRQCQGISPMLLFPSQKWMKVICVSFSPYFSWNVSYKSSLFCRIDAIHLFNHSLGHLFYFHNVSPPVLKPSLAMVRVPKKTWTCDFCCQMSWKERV